MIDMIINSVKMLLRKKGRTFLTLFGIAVGVASVVIINNISSCGSSAFTDEIDGLGMGGLTVSLKNQSATLSDNELETIKLLPYVDDAMPIMFESTDAYIKEKKNPVYLWGIDNYAKDVISLKILSGRFFNSGDLSSHSKNCIVDKTFAQNYYGTDNVTGKEIVINSGGKSTKYKIIGVLKTGSGLLQNVMGAYIPEFIYIPYTTMQQNLNSNNFSQIAIKVNENYDNEIAGKNIIKAIEHTTNMKDAYSFTDMAKQKENIGNIIHIFSLVITSVGVISLLVAGLSIMNVMLVSVTERTREIGIKKAIGAAKSSIVYEFLFESALVTLAGGIIGIIFGTLISVIGASILGFVFAFDFYTVIVILLFSVVIGIIFGIYPALKAASLKPVEALRSI